MKLYHIIYSISAKKQHSLVAGNSLIEAEMKLKLRHQIGLVVIHEFEIVDVKFGLN